MKRSEVVDKIEAFLYDSFPSSTSYNYAADHIMEIIEKLGMLPPVPENYSLPMCEIEDLEWEPEDE